MATEGLSSDHYRFLRLEYSKALDIIHRLHDVRMMYQKFYIALVASVVTLSILILQSHDLLKGKNNGSNLLLTVNDLLGIFFLLSGVIGVIVIRNLSSIRCNEVFYNNSVVNLRNLFFQELKLNDGHPRLNYARTADPRSADYQTICACSAINFVLLFVGILFLFPNLLTLQVAFVVILTLGVYSVVHYVLVERSLRNPRPDFESK